VRLITRAGNDFSSPLPFIAMGSVSCRFALAFEKPESASREARGGGGLGTVMRGPISEAVIIVILGFFIGGIAGAVVHFTFDSSNAIMPHPASYHALPGAPDYSRQ
jgi:hypothetical protein